MKYDDLPPAMRAQVDAKVGTPPGRPRPSRGGTGDGQPCTYRCGCGGSFDSFTKWERHARAEGPGHNRGEMVL